MSKQSKLGRGPDHPGLIRGGETGPAVVPGRVNKSLLIDALEHRTLKMPPEKKLPRSIIADFRKWIEQGALNLSCNECDTTNLTYTNGIKAIFDQNCISCHGTTTPQAGRSLTNYQQVQDAVLNTNLLERINGDPGVPVMPQGGKMPQCNIDKIEIWVSNGLPQ